MVEFGPHKIGESDKYSASDIATSIINPITGAIRGFFNERARTFDKVPHPLLQLPQNILKGSAGGFKDFSEIAGIAGRSYELESKVIWDGTPYDNLQITEHGPLASRRVIDLGINRDTGMATYAGSMTIDKNGNAVGLVSGDSVGGRFSHNDVENLGQRVQCFVEEFNQATGSDIKLKSIRYHQDYPYDNRQATDTYIIPEDQAATEETCVKADKPSIFR